MGGGFPRDNDAITSAVLPVIRDTLSLYCGFTRTSESGFFVFYMYTLLYFPNVILFF